MAARKHEKLLAKKLADLAATSEPRQRLHVAHEVLRAAIELEEAVVADGRAAGLTWTQIGSQFGMTKQAAQQRFKAKGT